jgi:probable HAF family extracellular repeat protein
VRLSTARSTVGRALRAALLASSALIPGLAQADDFQGLGFLPGTDTDATTGLSANGRVVIGAGFLFGSGFQKSFVWTNGAMTEITGVGSGLTQATGVSADGSIVVGSTFGGGATGFIWTPSGGAVIFGPPPGFTVAEPEGVNADGTVIVGTASGGLPDRAFRWTQTGGTVVLGVLPGDTNSFGFGVSGDGLVVVGQSANALVARAFRWTQTTGMVDLGALPGASYTIATATNYDGSVVVGYSVNPSAHAVQWKSAGIMALPELLGATSSEAYAINYDGSVIVGSNSFASGPSQATVWTTKGGVQGIGNLLVARGVNLTGWSLFEAKGVSADGTIVAGTGTDPSGQQESWIARIANNPGLITVGTVAQSFSGQAAVGQSGNAAITASLGTMSEYATQMHNTQGDRNSPYSPFGYGGYDSDPSASGILGMTVDLTRETVFGAALSANYIKTDMVYDGSAKMTGGSATVFLAHVPDAGLQWLAGVNGTTLKGDIMRGYLNGSALTSSSGSTIANGWGAIARLGWSFDNIVPRTQVTPFASYTYSTIHFDGYTETTGVFPAQFNGFNDNAQTSRLGSDVRYTLAPDEWVWGTLAWAHRLDGGKGSEITGNLIGLFSITAQGASVAQDWVEMTGGVRMPTWKNGALTASLTASVPTNYPTTYAARVGVAQTF